MTKKGAYKYAGKHQKINKQNNRWYQAMKIK